MAQDPNVADDLDDDGANLGYLSDDAKDNVVFGPLSDHSEPEYTSDDTSDGGRWSDSDDLDDDDTSLDDNDISGDDEDISLDNDASPPPPHEFLVDVESKLPERTESVSVSVGNAKLFGDIFWRNFTEQLVYMHIFLVIFFHLYLILCMSINIGSE